MNSSRSVPRHRATDILCLPAQLDYLAYWCDRGAARYKNILPIDGVALPATGILSCRTPSRSLLPAGRIGNRPVKMQPCARGGVA